MIGLESQPRRVERLVVQQVAGSAVLLNPDSGEYYGLDEVGGRVWELCDGTHSVLQIATLLAQEYDAPLATIQADVLDLLEDLAREKLVLGAA